MKISTLHCAISTIMALHCAFAFAQVDVLTQHNDLARTGWNNQETILNTTNVNSNSFGLLYSRTVDDQIYAQPLVVSGVNIPSKGTKNIVYICTVNNTIYAFDADDGTAPVYWQINFTPSGYRVPTGADIHPSLCSGVYWDFSSSFGLVGTPVIDKASNTMYFVTKVANPSLVDNASHASEYAYSSAGFYQYLHAIDLSTGAEKANSPMLVAATAPGTGDGNVGGVISFDPRRQFNRAGLVLSGGIVYIPYAAHCDWNPCHGWVLGYDAATLAQKIVYITTPNDGRGGIWMSGAAPAVDASGSLYFTTGNSYDDNVKFFDLPSVTANRGESVIKITPNAPDHTATSVSISSFFTPFNYTYLNGGDLDFPIQVMLVPNTNIALTGCKDNNLYVMDRTNLGGFNSSTNNVLQSINVGSNAQMHSSLAYFGGATNQYVYQLSENTLLQAFPVVANSLGSAITGNISGPTGAAGGFMSVSSNGSDPTTGILWVSQAVNGCNANGYLCQGILRAVKADDVKTELWNSTMNTIDNAGYFPKMTCPTIANGKVYQNTFSKQLNVYGLLASNPRCITNVALNKTPTASTQGTYAHFSFDGDVGTNWTSNATNNEYLYVDLGQQYSICRVIINWNPTTYGKDFNIDVSDDAVTWTTVQQFTGNTNFNSEFDGNVTGRYVRMAGVTSANNNGYSINEMQVLGQVVNTCVAPSGLTATNVTQNTATLSWQSVAGANSYIIQYKTPLVSSWITKTSNTNSINISALTCGTGYNFQVQSVCAAGQSSVSSGAFTTSNCTGTCGSLPTRYFAADVGDIGAAGSSCLSSGTYTLKGSGTGIGSTSDAFQFAFTDLNGNDVVTAQVISQDATNAANKAGIMIRDSVSNTSRFAFIATTSSSGTIFEYRSSPGGQATIVNGPNVAAPYWVQLVKTGTTYSAYVSPTGAVNSWVQVGSTVNLGFGTALTHLGMAVTSTNNTAVSTATLGSFSDINSPLPVNLISFTANNINNEHVMLKWSTSNEIKTDYFEVQRSNDGNSYTKIAKIKAAGNSNTNLYYSQQDDNPNSGINFYRLKQVDVDGIVYYSQIIAVNFGKHVIPQLWPNPAKAYFTVIAGAEAIKEITVVDASGKSIQHIVNESGSSGITIVSGNFASGVYIIKIKTATQVYQQKLFKE